ncbi:MAG: ThiF family adenylyltransferase [Planctomycetota bacterium]|nr:ThiF family adenylyltransferase [Planctomycetota bacterium]
MSASDTRFDRQIRFAAMGEQGQARLQSARVLLVGTGALGGVLAQNLVRAGVGELILCDRDIVELSNLPRQVLFEDRHAAAKIPKATAALETLARIGGPTKLRAEACHVDAENLPELADGVQLVLDGTDNLATRYLINDWCVAEDTPWVYGGVVGSGGLVLPILPGQSACLRCIFPDPPPAGSLPTCDSAGVIAPAVGTIASMQAGAALRILSSARGKGTAESPTHAPGMTPKLLQIDVWTGSLLTVDATRRPGCPTCDEGNFEFLHAAATRDPVVLCGRNTVQISGGPTKPDLGAIAQRSAAFADDVQNLGVLLRITDSGIVLTLFPDGRALVEGTDEVDRARALYDRYLGA